MGRLAQQREQTDGQHNREQTDRLTPLKGQTDRQMDNTTHLFDGSIDIVFARRFRVVFLHRKCSAWNPEDWDTYSIWYVQQM